MSNTLTKLIKPLYGKKILVTGAAGFIGSNLFIKLVENLNNTGAKVVGCDLLRPLGDGDLSRLPELLRYQSSILNLDLSLRESWDHFEHSFDVIFHLAGQISHELSMNNPESDFKNNQQIGFNLVRFLQKSITGRGVTRVVFTSTRQVYGKNTMTQVSELDSVSPPDFNAVHKIAVEQYLNLAANLGIADVRIFRIPNIYGPGMDWGNRQKGFIPVFIDKCIKGDPITLFGDGSQLRDIVFVNDIISALVAGASNEAASRFEIYNLGSTHPVSLKSFCDTLNMIKPTQYTLKEWPQDLKNFDVGSISLNSQKAKKHLDWNPTTDLLSGLKYTLNSILKA